jgi:DNA-binding transcriptional ArsR family regulator
MVVAETFKALGDPVRLEMIQRLSSDYKQNVGSLSSKLGITRQGARKHLQVLADVGLVSLSAKGRQTEVMLEVDSLLKAKSFITELEMLWDKRLLALRNFVETQDLKS